MKNTYLIGPSHVKNEFLSICDYKNVFKNVIMDGFHARPNWCPDIPKKLDEYNDKNFNLIWMVSDYKFHNYMYADIVKAQKNELFFEITNTDPTACIDYKFLEVKHIRLLGDHTCRIIDYLIELYPNIKLIFWCLYVRTKLNISGTIPIDLSYDAMNQRYRNNTIDIDSFVNIDNLSKMTRDSHGHPTEYGYNVLANMINSQINIRYDD